MYLYIPDAFVLGAVDGVIYGKHLHSAAAPGIDLLCVHVRVCSCVRIHGP
jgi:hypothetical protein